MADVFISYKREEVDWAQKVARGFSRDGISAFYDTGENGISIGESWDRRLERELEACRAVVALWSPLSVTSDNVRDEARRGNQRGILCPAFIRACVPPLGLGTLQTADISNWRGGAAHPEWRRLLASVAAHVRASGTGRSEGDRNDAFGPTDFLDTLLADDLSPLSRADFEAGAAVIGCEWQALAAVVHVESHPSGSGFASDGRPYILFERHLFSRKTKTKFDQRFPAISNRSAGGYPRTHEARWVQLAQAYALAPEAALQSASWGRFQILGQNFPTAGFADAHRYVRDMARSERNQLGYFIAFVRANGLADELQRKDWVGFASRYNGPAYAQFQYDTKMAAAYQRLKSNPIA